MATVRDDNVFRATRLRGDGAHCRVRTRIAAGLGDCIWRIDAPRNDYPDRVRCSYNGRAKATRHDLACPTECLLLAVRTW